MDQQTDLGSSPTHLEVTNARAEGIPLAIGQIEGERSEADASDDPVLIELEARLQLVLLQGESDRLAQVAAEAKLVEAEAKLVEVQAEFDEVQAKAVKAEAKAVEVQEEFLEAEKTILVALNSVSMPVRAAIQHPLPDYFHAKDADEVPGAGISPRTVPWLRPMHVRPWEEFEPDCQAVVASLDQNARVRRIPDSSAIHPGTEKDLHGLVCPVLLQLRECLFPLHPSFEQLSIGTHFDGGGISDIAVSLRDNINNPFVIMELNRPSIGMVEEGEIDKMHPAEVYKNKGVSATPGSNLVYGMLQTYNYLLMKGCQYGVFTNYDWWVFIHRRVVNGEEVLCVSRLYSREHARLPIASMLIRALRGPRETGLGSFDLAAGPIMVLPSSITRSVGRSKSARRSKGGKPSTKMPFFSVGTVVAGVCFTTTKAALGLESLSLHSRESSVHLSTSDKATTFRIQEDLVYRQSDFYKLARDSEYTSSELNSMVTREITAFMHLKHVWGVLVPEFVFFGHDISMLWVMVTKYVGPSLYHLAHKQGGLSALVKDKARKALSRLHSLGVLHGNTILQNVLYRESDESVLWIDFQSAKTTKRAVGEVISRQEMKRFELELNEITTLEPMIATLEPELVNDSSDISMETEVASEEDSEAIMKASMKRPSPAKRTPQLTPPGTNRHKRMHH